MKNFNPGLLFLALACLFSSCEQDITVETIVHEDGSLDRTITFEDVDSAIAVKNMFGISQATGWAVAMEEWDRTESEDTWTVQFNKKFASVEASNSEMATNTDTTFVLRSEVEEKFRWFYTYMKYSDTYGALNRFDGLNPGDYFTAEDYAFIDRLPAEGKTIPKADSLYLRKLNEKIFDHYASRAIYDENYAVLANVMRENDIEDRWIDTLASHKESLYRYFFRNQDDLVDEDFMLRFADSLQIPMPYPKGRDDFEQLGSDLEKRLIFMSDANSGKFSQAIQMPWPVINTNADSVAGTRVFWSPPLIKFMLKDYTMYAESRRINYWAVLVSGVLVLLTVVLLAGRAFRRDS
jgi:hypothetical protein